MLLIKILAAQIAYQNPKSYDGNPEQAQDSNLPIRIKKIPEEIRDFHTSLT